MTRRRAFFGGANARADAFIAAAGITDATQINAIYYLVNSLEATGLWNKCYCVYPLVGGTADAHKWNLISPLDLQSSYRLVYTGGITHSANGMQGNGSNGKATTFFIPSVSATLNDLGIGFCSRTNQARDETDMGGRTTSGTNVTKIVAKDSLNRSQVQVNTNSPETFLFPYVGTTIGNFGLNRIISTQVRYTINGTTNVITQASSALTTVVIELMAIRTGGAFSSFSSKQYTFFRIHQGLDDSEENTFQTIISNYNNILGR